MRRQKEIPLSVSLIIPIYNSQATAIGQLKQCEGILSSAVKEYEIIICDDKSTDNTAKLLKKNFEHKRCCRLILHKKNFGISKTIHALYKQAKYEYIILFSVDGDWSPKDIYNLLKTAFKTKADIVIGTREKKTYNFYRRIISFIYNFLPIIFFQVKTYDAASIKIFRKKLFTSLPITSKSIFFESEMIIKSVKKGYKVVTCPVNFIRRNKHLGGGGKPSLVIASFFDLIRVRLSKL